MRTIIITAGLLLVCLGLSFAQSDHGFSEVQMEKFVAVYMAQKSARQVADAALMDALERSGMTREQLSSLLDSALSGDHQPAGRKDSDFMTEFRQMADTVREERIQIEKSECDRKDLQYDVYQRMLAAYRTDHTFGRALKPYFANYVKSDNR